VISRVTIENFQSHKFTVIRFCEGVNVITGRSDSGKSSVLRALCWVFWNRPVGFAFRSHFAKPTEPTRVRVEFTDGSFVERVRGGRENKYIVNGVELEAVGSQVPEEILRVHRLEEFNVQSQFENYFLLQDSPGEVARKLNHIVGLDIIDDLVRKANSFVNSLRLQVSECEGRIEALEEEIKSYSFLDEIEPVVKEVEGKIDEFDKVESEFGAFEKLISDLEEVEKELKEFVDIERVVRELSELEEKVELFKEVFQEKVKLEETVKELEKVDSELCGFEEFGDFEELRGEVEEVCSLVDRFDRVLERYEILRSFVSDWWSVDEAFNRVEGDLKRCAEEYLRCIEGAGVCPVCGSSIDSRCVERIKGELLR